MVATLSRRNHRDVSPHRGGLLPNLSNLDEATIATYVHNGIMLRALHGTPDQQYHAAIACRSLLTRTRNPPLQSVIDAELLPSFVQLLASSSNPTVQVDAAWVITNGAAGSRTQTLDVCDSGALPVLVSLLNVNQGLLLLSLVALALANIAREVRDDVLDSGVIAPLLGLLDDHLTTNDEVCKPASPYSELLDLLCQLCRGTPRPKLELVESALPVLVHIGQKSRNEVVLVHVCWALESFFVENRGGDYYSAMHRRSVQAAIDAGALPVLVDLATLSVSLDGPVTQAAGALHALLALSSISTVHANDIVAAGGLVALRECLTHPVSCSIACDILTNLIKNRCLCQIMHHGIVPLLFHLIHTAPCEKVVGHVACVVWNACHAADLGASLVLCSPHYLYC